MTRTPEAIAGIALLATLAGCRAAAPPVPLGPPPENAVVFGVFADMPYSYLEKVRVRRMLARIEEHELGWVLVAGDIFWFPCSDEMMTDRRELFSSIRHPFVLTPGDNEWADCWEKTLGGFRPPERLRALRRIFFAPPGAGTGSGRLAVTSQAEGAGPYADFVENVFWQRDGVLFATVHVPGSFLAREPFPGRMAEDDAFADRVEAAALAWIRRVFSEARSGSNRALVLALHADMNPTLPHENKYRRAFAGVIDLLEREAATFERPILLVHGDGHELTFDRPFRHPETGEPLEHFERLEVPGSPEIAWVRVAVEPDAEAPFSFAVDRVPAGWWILGEVAADVGRTVRQKLSGS